MKYFLILNFLVISIIASAQDDALHYFQKRINGQKNTLPNFQQPKTEPPVTINFNPELREEQNYFLENGNKVIIQRQDNMPCVVPDMTQYNMPNAGSPEMLRTKPAIPNPGFDPKLNSLREFQTGKDIVK